MTITPPMFPQGPGRRQAREYPAPSTRLGKAWAAAWADLTESGAQFVDGTELAERSAKVADLQPVTMITLFTRAATAGLLDRAHKSVTTTRGPRKRTFYRIPQA